MLFVFIHYIQKTALPNNHMMSYKCQEEPDAESEKAKRGMMKTNMAIIFCL